MKKIILIALLLSISTASFARSVRINTQPSHARIFVSGQEVGTGTAVVRVPRQGTVLLTFTAEGYYAREARLSRAQAQKSNVVPVRF